MTQTYQLKHPVTLKRQALGGPMREEIISEVTIRRVKAKDLKMIDPITGDVTRSLALLGAVTGLPQITLDEFDAEDIQLLGAIVSDFFRDTRATGEGSSEI